MTEGRAGAAVPGQSGRALRLSSGHVADSFDIVVRLPDEAQAGVALPVVYTFDADFYFGGYAALASQLQACGEVRPFVLVGVGYSRPELADFLRMRDFYEPDHRALYRDKILALAARRGRADREALAEIFASTGADQFQRFVESELMPAVEAICPAPRHRNLFCGYSSGGAFGLRLLARRAAGFHGYIINSPATTMGGTDFVEAMLAADPVAAAAAPARLYLSVGTLEDHGPGLADFRLREGCERLAAGLAGRGDLDLTFDLLDGEMHGSAWAAGFVRGIRHFLATDGVPAASGRCGA